MRNYKRTKNCGETKITKDELRPLRSWERQKRDHEAKCRKIVETIREEYPKLDGFSEPFTAEGVSRKSEIYNGVSWPTTRKCLEEIVEKGTEVNGQVQKLGKTGRATVYVRDDPSLSTIKPEDIRLKTDVFRWVTRDTRGG